MSRNWIIAGVAAVCLVVGIGLSHRIDGFASTNAGWGKRFGLTGERNRRFQA
jgi:hypothetical protein